MGQRPDYAGFPQMSVRFHTGLAGFHPPVFRIGRSPVAGPGAGSNLPGRRLSGIRPCGRPAGRLQMNRNRIIGSRLAWVAVVAVVGMQAWCVQAAPAKTVREVVLAWNEVATEAMVAFARDPATAPGVPPNRESRIYAMAFVAMHDTLNAIDRKYEPYACRGRGPNASPTAAVATAAYRVLSATFPPGADRFDAAYRVAMAEEPDAIPGRKQAGIQLGRRCADAILRLRADDGADRAQVPDYNSAHSAAGGAARAVLYRFFGRDDIPFAQTSVTRPGISRNFTSFTQAADENGLSRILVGFHFRLAVTAGRAQGEAVGTWVFDNALRPM